MSDDTKNTLLRIVDYLIDLVLCQQKILECDKKIREHETAIHEQEMKRLRRELDDIRACQESIQQRIGEQRALLTQAVMAFDQDPVACARLLLDARSLAEQLIKEEK